MHPFAGLEAAISYGGRGLEDETGPEQPGLRQPTMTEKYELSRRKTLAGLATIGAAGAGAGLGTSALFSDEESFTNNQMVAGELDLIVDYWTGATAEAVDGGTTGSSENQGGVSGQYVLNDVKPGDSGSLVFCPKIVDNPAWLWAGSTGYTQYENGYTEPEEDEETDEISDRGLDGDIRPDGTPNESGDGEGYGELAENIQVTVSYCEPSDDLNGDTPSSSEDFQTIRELNNPEDYTLADLLLELQTGFQMEGLVEHEETEEWVPTEDGEYPSSPDSGTQTGPCLCIDWNIPTEVGNVIQSDGLVFDFGFHAVQSRHVDDPATENPYADAVFTDEYENPEGHNHPTDGTVVSKVTFGENNVVLSFEFQDDDDGMDFLDDSDYSSANLPVAIDTDNDGLGTTDYQVIWDPDKFDGSGGAVGDFSTAPFAMRDHDGSGNPGSFVALPGDFSAVKTGDAITFGLPSSEVDDTLRFGGFASTGGEGPVVHLPDNTFSWSNSGNSYEATDPDA